MHLQVRETRVWFTHLACFTASLFSCEQPIVILDSSFQEDFAEARVLFRRTLDEREREAVDLAVPLNQNQKQEPPIRLKEPKN